MSEIRLSRSLVLQSVALLLLGLSLPAKAHNGKTAYAIPLSGITIDGKLDDWPEGMTAYPITEVLKGWSAYVDPGSPVDLTARFRVGYDAAKGYLYIAIEVQDESLVASGGWASDVCEVYIDGTHDAIGRTAQYCYVPGNNTPYGFPTNPGMSGGQDISKSHVEAAFTRRDQLTTYEWSVEVFDTYPTQKADLRSGKNIGFDIAVVDKDLDASYSWVSWTPGGGKGGNSSLLGDLIMVERYADIGSITGRITNRDGGAPIRGARVGISQEDKPALVALSDSAGIYHQGVFQGTYTVRAFARGVRDTVVQKDVKVTASEETTVNLSLEDLGTCFYVDDDALDEGGGSASHPFQTIQKALEATSEGDTVRVMAGTYREPVVLVSGVTLLGAGPDSTILDGEGKRGVVSITNVNHVALEGFAIVRGQGRPGPGQGSPFGGVLVASASHVRIAHNLISGNTAMGAAGGGISCPFNVDSTVIIAHNLIMGNATERPQWGGAPGGGGIYLQEARPLIYNNTVIYNKAVGDGGGILCEGASPHLRDNIIAYNLNGGLTFKPVSYISPEQAGPGPRLSHNDIWNNAEYDYSGLNPGEGDISVDPEFLAPREGDFSLSRGSPCKKAGTTGSMGADIAALQRGEQGLRAAIPPKEVLKQFQSTSPPSEMPVVRKVNYISVNLPPVRKLQVDTVQAEVHPLDLGLLDRTEKLYDRSSGLPSNQVNVVAPAPDGSIWVGTYDRGAARYDGLWTYLDTLSGLPGNQVLTILPTQDGTVWIATTSGLTRYRNGQVMTVSKEGIGNLIEAPGGGLWLSGNQSVYLDTSWTYFSFAGAAGQPYQQSFPLLAEQTGAVWGVLNSGFGPSSPASTVALRYTSSGSEAYEFPPTNSYGISFNQAQKGRFWIGFSEYKSIGGNSFISVARSVGLLDTTASHLQVYRLPEEWESPGYNILQDRAGLLWIFGGDIILQFDGRRWFGAKKVEFVSPQAALDPEGNFWFASGRGLVRYGPQTWTTYKGEERLEGKQVSCVVEDRSGNLWFGSEKGLARRNADGSWTRLAVTDTLVTDLLVDKQGQVWAATAWGVHRYNGRQWATYTAKNGLPDTVTTVLAEGADGRIWAGGPKGLFWYDGQRWQKVPVSLWRASEWQDPNSINKLYADPEGRLWVGTNGGLYVYEQGKVRDYFEMFYPDRGVDLDRLFVLERPEEIRQKLKEMLKDEVDMAWFLAKAQPDRYYGTAPDPSWSRVAQAYTQLVKEDAEFRKLSRRAVEEGYVDQGMRYGYESEVKPEWRALVSLGSEPIFTIFADKGGALWIPSSSGGLFTRSDSAWTYYQQSTLPFEGQITNTTTDRQGNLWLATTQGAVRYGGQHWTTFDASDGLADNQVSDILEDHEGNIWFATAKGVTRYRPDTRPPQTRMVRAPEDTVGYGTSTLTFEFEGGDWEWEQRGLTFSYSLLKEDRKPKDGDWSEWGAQKFVQVPPPGDGHFIFQVRARDKALNVDPTPATHAFYIAPPIWKVLWFQTSGSFGLLLIVFSSTYAIRRHRAFLREQQARLQTQEQLNKELEKELQTAHDLQMALMPKVPPQIAGFEITGRCTPANHVGGDLFQYFHQNRNLSISLADVTGHAMEAAIPMVMFSGILKSQMEMGGSVAELFSRLNRSLHGTLTSHTYVCLAMGELDSSSRLFRFSNSGSPYPYHYRAATGEVVELEVDAYPLGVRPDTIYPTIEVQLEPGDRVVFCSDGIIEAANTSGELFGFERTAETVRRGCAEDLSAEALLVWIIQEVKTFSGDVPQGDDQTVVVLKVDDRRSA